MESIEKEAGSPTNEANLIIVSPFSNLLPDNYRGLSEGLADDNSFDSVNLNGGIVLSSRK